MAQGTRGRLIRAATTGFGMMFCTGLFGCMNWDKPKDVKNTKPGLPGTPMLPQGTGAANKSWQPNGQPFNGPATTTVQPASGFGTAQPAGTYRPGTNGLNTNTGAGAVNQQFNNWPQPGNPGTIGNPAQPGIYSPPSVVPVGGVGAAPSHHHGGVAAGYTPPPPALFDTPLPPTPPMSGASGHNEFAGGVAPPAAPGSIAPLAPPAPPGVGPTYPTKGGF